MPPAESHTAYLSVGSNLGDKVANCRFGIHALHVPGLLRVTGLSRFYRTSPVDFLDQDWFVNAAVRVETGFSPEALLRHLQDIQRAAGREPSSIRFGPRVLDLDILFYDDRVLSTEALTIPHPRLQKRRFVLEPLCDINPRIVHPVLLEDVRSLLGRIEDPQQELFPVDD